MQLANIFEMASLKSIESICKEIHDCAGDERLVFQVMVSLSQDECRKIRETHMKFYGEDLIQVFGSCVLKLMLINPFERDADVAREALHRSNAVDYKSLVEIYTCRKSSHVLLIQRAYHAKYRSHLDLDIATIEPPHPFQKMLMAISASHKAHDADVSQHIAKCDAKRLYETGEGKRRGGVDEAVIVEMFSKRSIPQLKLTFSTYKHIYGHTYTSFLKNQEYMFGGIEDAVRVVAKCICNPRRYYAKVVYGCMREEKRREIMRIMVSRAEVDMKEIEREMKKKYEVDLKYVITHTFPLGIDRDFLLAFTTKTSIC